MIDEDPPHQLHRQGACDRSVGLAGPVEGQAQLVHQTGSLKWLPKIFAPKIPDRGAMKVVVGEPGHAGQCFPIAGFQMQWPGDFAWDPSFGVIAELCRVTPTLSERDRTARKSGMLGGQKNGSAQESD